MPATVWCKDEQKKEIKEYLTKELVDLLDMINEFDDMVDVSETDYGFHVEFPHGEIYGYSFDYVCCVSEVFKDLKKKYNDIAIDGIAYEYETITCMTCGFYFHCKETDKELHVTNDWQECAACCDVVEGETFYNSSQFDFEEGTTYCLCCPTCMLQYCIDPSCDDIDGNASFENDEIEDLYEDDNTEEKLKEYLWQRIVDNVDDYLDDFAAKKDRIVVLKDIENIAEDKKDFLLNILQKIKDVYGK